MALRNSSSSGWESWIHVTEKRDCSGPSRKGVRVKKAPPGARACEESPSGGGGGVEFTVICGVSAAEEWVSFGF